MKGLIAASLLAPTLPAAAQDLTCTATQQCRGDAPSMCAPSGLTIEVAQTQGPRARLWIDGQGPYAARVSDDTITLDSFNGRYRLTLRNDGAFSYTGNRGKTFTGRCEGRF
ncbi:hypothetical protein M8756_01570 [Lutimaribacter sp. EGI FJ00015]|uniref:Uncharacterized protein n=1 Tax=Lutimaribacter degradans TaxID=2945989 RepID=A0ACC5ZSA8_9RHOB|nr:hypothetical protein [Lutimaribacter sp. EGI FJ00013]MCM2561070.1 hypothetical protein [Lutimaribacter sp. EGI FJ00013]MCO0611981.1 hypothetical protein [Lutimaribacter sp. EGI FJ00015]MCO0634898.1 hypothetical protein [Lutimaribacter sp. EGI FJ00014]